MRINNLNIIFRLTYYMQKEQKKNSIKSRRPILKKVQNILLNILDCITKNELEKETLVFYQSRKTRIY